MNILKYITIFLLVGLLLPSCENYFGEDSNLDPDNPTEATLQVMLPQIQARLAYTIGGDFTRFTGINSQQITGVNRQFAVFQNYGIVGGDCDAMWSNIYVGTLNNNRVMVNQAKEDGFNHFVGIGLLLESYAMMSATDIWGSLPYSDAFGFSEKGVYTPTFDTQESIYTAIFANITEAIALLNGPDGGVNPSNSDLIYKGNAAKWLKFANVLEARGKLHLAKRSATAYSEAVAAINRGGFSNSADDFGFKFGAAATERAPFYQYIEQRDDCEVGVAFVNLLTDLTDPRISNYGFTHDLPHPVFLEDQFLKLVSFTEQNFILAEALLPTDPTAAYTAFVAGIASSFKEAGMSIADSTAYFESGAIPSSGASLTLNHIMTQKYIALYTNPEVYTDWRRTGFPELTPNTGSQIPRRLPYSEVEQLANPNCPTPAEITIFDKVWWDN